MLYQNENKPDVYHVDASKIQDLTSFHEVFAQACNFPDFYGKNFDAWHDCLSDIHHDTTIIFEHF
jgi:RNAse (barnase) inhibitor barstar